MKTVTFQLIVAQEKIHDASGIEPLQPTDYLWEEVMGIYYPTKKINHIAKNFNVMYNIGKAKYVVNFHDGVKVYDQGSPFYDINIFKNKLKLNAFVKELKANGYVER